MDLGEFKLQFNLYVLSESYNKKFQVGDQECSSYLDFLDLALNKKVRGLNINALTAALSTRNTTLSPRMRMYNFLNNLEPKT